MATIDWYERYDVLYRLYFQMAGYSGNSNLVASSIQYVINTCVTVPALYFIDKVGRRPLLIGGATMMMAFQFGLAGILGQYSIPWPDSGNDSVNIRIPEDNKSASKVPLLVATCSLLPLPLLGGRYLGLLC